MRRVHVLEFEDLAWFPGWLRDCMTRLLLVLGERLGVHTVIGDLVGKALERSQRSHVVDLGSGSGGPMPGVVEALRTRGKNVGLTLTDKYPNEEAAARFSESGHTMYLSTPVDATDLKDAPEGLKTMINSFHHMRVEEARSILRSAQRERQPLLVYEMDDGKMPFAVWLVLLPIALPVVFLSALVLTPFVHPMSARQWLFTLLPVIPFFYAWDAQASMARIYSRADLEELLASIGEDGAYCWEIAPATNAAGKTLGMYLLGLPTTAPLPNS